MIEASYADEHGVVHACEAYSLLPTRPPIYDTLCPYAEGMAYRSVDRPPQPITCIRCLARSEDA